MTKYGGLGQHVSVVLGLVNTCDIRIERDNEKCTSGKSVHKWQNYYSEDDSCCIF